MRYGLLALPLIGIMLLAAGCLDLDEVINPDLELSVTGVMVTNLSAGSPREVADNMSEYVYVKVNVTNKNDDMDHIFLAEKFTAEDDLRNPFQAVSLANLQERENTFTLKPEEQREFYVVFLLPRDVKVTLLIMDMGADEDFTDDIPDYTHLA